MKRLVLALALVLITCDSNFTGPEPVTLPAPPPPLGDAPPPEPVFNPGIDFSWMAAGRGILLFPATQSTELQVRRLHNKLLAASWPQPIVYHVCAEVADWGHTRWNDGPPAFGRENLDNLTNYLDTTADMGALVLLDAVCTIRDTAPFERINDFVALVAERARDYNHVALHVANEHWHPASHVRNISQVRAMRDTLRNHGFMGPIGADDKSISLKDVTYNPGLKRLGMWPDFHPPRNPPPGRGFMRGLVAANPWGRVVISEPIAYSVEYGHEDCCTADKEVILRNMRNAEAEGIVWFYHGTDNLGWPDTPIGWVPR